MGYCLYVFVLTSNLATNSYHWDLIRNGSLHVEIRLRISLTEAVNCVVFGEFCSIVEVDKYINVSTDYN